MRTGAIILGALAFGAAVGAGANLFLRGDADPVPLPYVEDAAPTPVAPPRQTREEPADVPLNRVAAEVTPAEQPAEAALVVTLRDPLFGEAPETCYVAVVAASGNPPRTTRDMPWNSPQLKRAGDGSFALEELEPGDYYVVAARTRKGTVVTTRLKKGEEPASLALDLPAGLTPDLVELRVNGPDGALLSDVRVMTTRSIPVRLVRGAIDGEAKLWFSEEALRRGDKFTERLVFLVDGLGSRCPRVDPAARKVVVNFAPACDVIVRTRGAVDRDLLIDIRPDVPARADGYRPGPLLDAVPTTVGRTIRFGGLQPGNYRIAVRGRLPNIRGSYPLRAAPLVERRIVLSGSQEIDFDVPQTQNLIVETKRKRFGAVGVSEVGVGGGRLYPYRRQAERYGPSFVQIRDIPEGVFKLEGLDEGKRTMQIRVPYPQRVIRTAEAPR